MFCLLHKAIYYVICEICFMAVSDCSQVELSVRLLWDECWKHVKWVERTHAISTSWWLVRHWRLVVEGKHRTSKPTTPKSTTVKPGKPVVIDIDIERPWLRLWLEAHLSNFSRCPGFGHSSEIYRIRWQRSRLLDAYKAWSTRKETIINKQQLVPLVAV